MKITKTLLAVAFSAGLFSAPGAHAALELTLGGRAVNDTDLNITWLADANLAATETFGVHDINANGSMRWVTAVTWIRAMNSARYLGFNDWRLPTVTDTFMSGCNQAYSGTDCGYNVNTASGEMAHLWYDELGNKAYFNTAGSGPQPGWGLTNTGPFTNVQRSTYWSGTEYVLRDYGAWTFRMGDGSQDWNDKANVMFAWAVRPGQVGVVPEPETYALLLAGLGLLGITARRRKQGI